MVSTVKPELLELLLTAILTGVLWIPVVIGYVASRGPLKPADYEVAPTSPLPDWVNRANRAHQNAVESFAPFAAVVLIAHAAGVSTAQPFQGNSVRAPSRPGRLHRVRSAKIAQISGDRHP